MSSFQEAGDAAMESYRLAELLERTFSEHRRIEQALRERLQAADNRAWVLAQEHDAWFIRGGYRGKMSDHLWPKKTKAS